MSFPETVVLFTTISLYWIGLAVIACLAPFPFLFYLFDALFMDAAHTQPAPSIIQSEQERDCGCQSHGEASHAGVALVRILTVYLLYHHSGFFFSVL